MRITVTGRHIDVGQALRRHVEENLPAAVGKYFDRALEAHVTFAKRAPFFTAEIAVHVGRGIEAHAGDEADDAYRAFDKALEHLAKRLRRNKRRLRDHHNAEARTTERALASQFVIEGPEHRAPEIAENAAGGEAPLVIAEMETDVPVLTVGDAVMRLDLGSAPALLFRNAAHDGLNMIYRRSDGHIGWVDPHGAHAPKR